MLREGHCWKCTISVYDWPRPSDGLDGAWVINDHVFERRGSQIDIQDVPRR